MLKMLRQEKPFAILLTGHVLSKIGDGLQEFIFIVTVLKVTGNSLGDAGLIYFFRFIPYLLLGPLGGALADRLPRRWLMLNADLARMAVTGLFCALLWTGQVSGPAGAVMLAVAGLLMTALRTLFQPAFQASLPVLVRREHLSMANALTQIVSEVGGLVGPALGAAAMAAIGNAGAVLLLDAFTYGVSALCIAWIAEPARPGVPNAAEGQDPQGVHGQSQIQNQGRDDAPAPLSLRALYGDFGGNLRQLMRSRSALFVTIAHSAACILFVGAAQRLLIPALLKSAGHSDSELGYTMSLTALGAILGAAAFGRVLRDFGTRRLMAYWGLYGLVLALLPVCVGSLAVFLLGSFVFGLCGAFIDVVLPTNIQRLSTDANLGKNFSLFSTLANAGEALAGGVAGLLALCLPVAASLSVLGLGVAAVAAAGHHQAGRRADGQGAALGPVSGRADESAG